MATTGILINYAGKELTRAQFKRRCDRLLTQKLVCFTEEEKKEIEAMKRKRNITKALISLKLFLKSKLNSVNVDINKFIFVTLKDMALKGECWENHLDELGFMTKGLEKVYEFFSCITYKPSTNPEIREIEKNLRKKGVKAKFSDKSTVDFAKLTQESVLDIERQGAKVPKRINVSPLLVGENINGMVIIGPTESAKTLFINPEFAYKTQEQLETGAQLRYKCKESPIPSPKDTIYHDAAHIEHSEEDIKDLFIKSLSSIFFPKTRTRVLTGKEKASLKREVSGYAERDPKGLDAVADIRAGILAGNTYSDNVMNIYRKLKGPVLRSSQAG